MANAALRNVKVLPNSANMEEARHRVFEFFRTACRLLPSVMEIYNLYDVVSVSELRSSVASQIRNNIHVTDPKVFCDRYAAFQGDGRAEECCGPFKAEASYHWSVRSWSASAGFSHKRPGHLYFSEEFLQHQLLLKFGHELCSVSSNKELS
ncbi:NADH dehydrogenase [ubiquinone] 1 alpha subcomplex subunit 6 [Glycine soja]|uniref:NADH dehydrogenase [ubiquinone] 1 alpha subcomplex subunit 6 n=2 Tax=Glycine subgen. Soja TaxID=1462606 RepID=I1L280_SOYBN|nr:NADH dehydrogenase [ubiquinone] 1 alpha subcomplex subunit 6 [Glycine soja]